MNHRIAPDFVREIVVTFCVNFVCLFGCMAFQIGFKVFDDIGSCGRKDGSVFAAANNPVSSDWLRRACLCKNLG